MVKIYDYNSIDIDNLVYDDPNQGKMGGQYVKITNGPNKILIQTPKSYLPFGINRYEGGYGTTYSIDISSNNETFNNFLNKFDELNKKRAQENMNKWFSKNLDEDAINQIYKTQLKKSDSNYPPLMRIKIPTNSKGPLITIFDIDKNVISLDQVQKQCDVSAVIELTGLYFKAKEFGMSWKVVQLMVYPRLNLNTYAFVDDDDDDFDDE